MSNVRPFLLAFAAVAATFALPGCAAEPDAVEASDESEVSSQTIGSDAVALEVRTIPMGSRGAGEVERVVVLAEATRFANARQAIRRSSEAIPRCMPSYRHEIRFLDAKGQETSKATLSCGGIGRLTRGTQSIQIRASDAFEKELAKPTLLGDVLWGITKVEVRRPARQDVKVAATQASVATLLDAMVEDQKIEPLGANVPVQRCPPTYIATFHRGSAPAASVTFRCEGGSEAKVRAIFSPITADAASPAALGYVDVDPRPFGALFGGT